MAQTNSKIPLSQSHPELAAQWHPTRNGSLTPDQVTFGSGERAWWICAQASGHEWPASISNRTSGGSGCPFCAGQKLSATNSLAFRDTELAAQWHPTKNGSLTPDHALAGSAKKAWWICPKGPDHEWEASIVSRI